MPMNAYGMCINLSVYHVVEVVNCKERMEMFILVGSDLLVRSTLEGSEI